MEKVFRPLEPIQGKLPFDETVGDRLLDPSVGVKSQNTAVSRARTILLGVDADPLLQNYMADMLYQATLADQVGREILASFDSRVVAGVDWLGFPFGIAGDAEVGSLRAAVLPDRGLYDPHFSQFTVTAYVGVASASVKIDISTPREETLFYAAALPPVGASDQISPIELPQLGLSVAIDGLPPGGYLWAPSGALDTSGMRVLAIACTARIRPRLSIPDLDILLSQANSYKSDFALDQSAAALTARQMLSSPLLVRRVVGAALCCALTTGGV